MPWLEKHIEDDFVEWVEESYGDWYVLKAKMHRKGWPDRLILGPRRTIYFIEFKQPGEEPSKVQEYVFGLIRKLGFKVYVCESTESAQEIFRSYLHT